MESIKFRIHNEGWVYVVISAILTIVFLPFFPFLGLILFILTSFIIYFFRDPQRVVPLDDFILSPADGTISFVGESSLPSECNSNDKFIKISIFLSIFNVHVNRIPTNGKIESISYIHGKFINANLDKSSEFNERNIITVKKDDSDKIILVQIAGLIARRIVCDLKIGQNVSQGDKFGIIKFGSRVDLYLPKNYNIMVSKGQILIGGETIIANNNNVNKITKTIKK